MFIRVIWAVIALGWALAFAAVVATPARDFARCTPDIHIVELSAFQCGQ